VARWQNNIAEVAVIPYTYEPPISATARAGDAVNLEGDILGKYVERYLEGASKRGIEQTNDRTAVNPGFLGARIFPRSSAHPSPVQHQSNAIAATVPPTSFNSELQLVPPTNLPVAQRNQNANEHDPQARSRDNPHARSATRDEHGIFVCEPVRPRIQLDCAAANM